MNTVILSFILIPLFGFFLNILLPKTHERAISRVAFTTTGLQNLAVTVFLVVWVGLGHQPINIKEFALYRTSGYEYLIDLYFDSITAVFLLVGSVLAFLISLYSRYYLHREEGYKRFFNTILFFYVGYNIIILSGNFETLFIGWEILGISSFLLIAYYRDRYLPVRNALKVFSIYRVSDIALILAMWMSHHLWHHNVTFLELNNYDLVDTEIQHHFYAGLFISVMILVSAIVKSAQFPFSSWLPRAMEGPTPSSAIFYGSLAVHIGVFLLLRTFSFWEHITLFRWAVGTVGLVTSLLATLTGNVQTTVKSQIAYSSIAQIGLIFIEIALGLQVLALVHFAGNAFLRTYQLLVSPSVVTYLIREQFYNWVPAQQKKKSLWWQKVRNSIYVLSVKEWNLDTYQFRYLWNPFKKVGRLLHAIPLTPMLGILFSLYALGCFILWGNQLSQIAPYFPMLFSLIGLMVMIRSFSERKNPQTSLMLVGFGHFWTALAISFNERFDIGHNLIYLSGVVVSMMVGYGILQRLRKKEGALNLNGFMGHVYEHKWMAFMFLLSCLGLAGFPITPTFLGEDLIYSHIHEDQAALTTIVSVSFIIAGLSVIRIYSRVFLGPHTKPYHPIAYRSS